MAVAGPTFRIRESLQLAEDEVQVWRAELDKFVASEEYWFGLLSADEQERTQRFHSPLLRSRFGIGRGLLRTLLSNYLRVAPESLLFRYSATGKPELDGPLSNSPVRFNLSHSDDLALFAFARDRTIGVDVEKLRPNVDMERIADRFFSKAECVALGALHPVRKSEGFFNCWTRKEAFIKALGEGLSHSLDSFEVSLAPDETAELRVTRPDPDEKNHWWMQAVDAGPDYAAAVVARGRNLRLRNASISSIMEVEPR
jgi:4'-phosphopantetheinyl transferase